MKPYYQDSAVTIYHGDCREYNCEGINVICTDPPYGISYNHGVGGGKLARSTVFDHHPVVGDDSPFDPSPWVQFGSVVLWGANHYASRLPDSSFWLVWDKRDGVCSNDQADCELAWVKGKGNARIIRHLWNGMLKASERGEARVHPTQKPVSVMSWSITQGCGDGIILDPFMGSGTTLRAAKDLGRKAIGIEIEEKYCEIAAKRMAQEVFTFCAPKSNPSTTLSSHGLKPKVFATSAQEVTSAAQ